MSVQPLDGVSQGWPIDLLEHVPADFDEVIRPNPQEELIEGRMVQPTQGYAVADDGFTLWFGIRNDVSRIKQFTMAEAAEGTLVLIGTQHTFTEGALMEPAAGQRRHILAPGLNNFLYAAPGAGKDIGLGNIVNRHRKGEVVREVMDYVGGPHDHISAWDDAVAIHQW